MTDTHRVIAVIAKELGDHHLTANCCDEVFHRLLRYEADTGKFYWRPRPPELFRNARAASIFAVRYAGREAGSIGQDGYLRIRVLRRLYLGHRLAWLLHYGEWPEQTDHINGNRSDNRIANLRSVDIATNNMNKGFHSRNTSGVLGISWVEKRQRWNAYITVDGRRRNLGYFSSFKSALKARRAALREAGFHPNHAHRSRTTVGCVIRSVGRLTAEVA